VVKTGKRAAENRQLVELFQTKEWSAFETLLDKCLFQLDIRVGVPGSGHLAGR